MAVPANAENKGITWTNNYTQSHKTHRNVCVLTSNDTQEKLYNSIICKTWDLETIQISINGERNRSCNTIYPMNYYAVNEMNKPLQKNHTAEFYKILRKKKDIKDYIMHDHI